MRHRIDTKMCCLLQKILENQWNMFSKYSLHSILAQLELIYVQEAKKWMYLALISQGYEEDFTVKTLKGLTAEQRHLPV